MAGGSRTKMKPGGGLVNVLTFLWGSRLCGFESLSSPCCHWPVNTTSCSELSWNKDQTCKKFSVIRSRDRRLFFDKIKHWNVAMLYFRAPLMNVYCICSALLRTHHSTPVCITITASQSVTAADSDWSKVTDFSSRPRPKRSQHGGPGSFKGHRVMHPGYYCGLFSMKKEVGCENENVGQLVIRVAFILRN